MKTFSMLAAVLMLGGGNLFAQNEVECPFTSINSDITSNTTLSASTLYRVEGCIHVQAGKTLTIPANTKVLFQKSSTATLIIDKGATLIVQGTSSNPVIFTSDQKPGFRTPGDYSGLIINGKATNNFPSNVMITENRVCDVDAGGTDDDDNSGEIKYLRMEYSKYGLTLASVGRGTVLENIQVSYPEHNAFEFWGGVPQAKRLIALNAKVNDFEFKYGNRAKVQSALGLRLDASANYGTAPNSNGVLIANNDNAGSSYAGTPQTRPILDKFSLLGPAYCGATGLSSNFKNAVLAHNNAQLGMYHTYISGWPTGLRLEESGTLANAVASPQTIKFEANSFINNAVNYSNGGTWSATCATTMANWMTKPNPVSCEQRYNLFSGISSGYSSTICDDYCANPAPDISFLMDASDLGDTRYANIADLNGDAFFETSDYRGAFDETTDWTATWTAFCPQSKVYCVEQMRGAAPTGIKEQSDLIKGLTIAPNPVSGMAYAEFSLQQAGKVTINLINSIGQVVSTQSSEAAVGKQRMALNAAGLPAGIYMVNVSLDNGSAYNTKLVIR